jgi:hypothetical protein
MKGISAMGDTGLLSNLAPEHELVVRASRRYSDGVNDQRLAALLRGSINWRSVLAQARRHGVMPLLYFKLRCTSSSNLQELMDGLAMRFQASARHNLYLLGELHKILDLLEQHDVQCMPWKGPTLAQLAFGDVALREFSDVDVLIREYDVRKALAVLKRYGFTCMHRAEWVEPYLRFGHELDFASPDGSFQLDLQWRFAKKWVTFPVDEGAVWERATFSSVSGRAIRQPALHDYILLLCGHGYRHCWCSLKWISDISAFLHAFNGQVDWSSLVAQARASGGLRILGLGAWFAQELGGTYIERAAARTLFGQTQVQKLGRQIVRQLFASEAALEPHGTMNYGGRLHFNWEARERLRDKVPSVLPLLVFGKYQLRRYVRHYTRRLLESAGSAG